MFISAVVVVYSVFCTIEFACWFRQCQTGRNDLFLRVFRSRGFAKRKSLFISDANLWLLYLLDVLWDFRFLLWDALELNRCFRGGVDAFYSGKAWAEKLIISVKCCIVNSPVDYVLVRWISLHIVAHMERLWAVRNSCRRNHVMIHFWVYLRIRVWTPRVCILIHEIAQIFLCNVLLLLILSSKLGFQSAYLRFELVVFAF